MRIGSKSWREQQKAIAILDAERYARRCPFGRLIDTTTGRFLRAATREESEISGSFQVDGKAVIVRP